MHKDLKDGATVATIALRKDWSKSPSYWITIWAVPRGALNFWYAVRTWKFKREGKEVAGEALGDRYTSVTSAVAAAEGYLSDKMGMGYVVHGATRNPDFEGSHEILASLETTMSVSLGDHHQKDPEAKNKFEQAKAKRVREARW